MDLTSVERALRSATAGPWKYGGPPGKYLVYSESGSIIADVQSGVADAQLIANARGWLQLLVAEVRELQRRERELLPAVREKAHELEVQAREWIPALLVKLRELGVVISPDRDE